MKTHTGALPGVLVYNLPHLIEAKFSPPYSVSIRVNREELITRINTGLNFKILLVSAPMGSGKTTLLSQWHQQMISDHNIAWLSLDEYNNESVHFFSYLNESLQRTLEGFNDYRSDQSVHGKVISLDYIIGVLLEGLNKISHNLFIVLDDFQFITDRAILYAFSLLLQHSPPNCHWIISSRSTPPLNLGRLSLQDQLFVVTGDDLKFDADTIFQLGSQLHGSKISREDAEYVLTKTGGWAAGIKIAILSAGKQSHSLAEEQYAKFREAFPDDLVVGESKNLWSAPILLEPLTDREIEMLSLLSRGLSNKEISRHSGIALSTTKWHLKNVFSKLNVKARTEAILRAQELKLIDNSGKLST